MSALAEPCDDERTRIKVDVPPLARYARWGVSAGLMSPVQGDGITANPIGLLVL